MTVTPVSHDPVLRWAGYAQQAGQHWGIPTSVLLGLIGVESGGKEGLVSSAGAGGLTQFTPATARQYAVNVAPGNARSQIEGAAHYLHDLGYTTDPAGALAKYNGGPANPQPSYARTVLARAKSYAHLNTSSTGRVPAGSAASTQDASRPTSPATGDASDDGLITDDRKQGLLKGLLTVALVGGGAGLAWLGTHQLAGART